MRRLVSRSEGSAGPLESRSVLGVQAKRWLGLRGRVRASGAEKRSGLKGRGSDVVGREVSGDSAFGGDSDSSAGLSRSCRAVALREATIAARPVLVGEPAERLAASAWARAVRSVIPRRCAKSRAVLAGGDTFGNLSLTLREESKPPGFRDWINQLELDSHRYNLRAVLRPHSHGGVPNDAFDSSRRAAEFSGNLVVPVDHPLRQR